jgi:16S rRNA (cytosine1402-N4)-methyltransferase
MPEEVLEYLGSGAREGVVWDATLGLGGHTERLLERWPRVRVIGMDRDSESIGMARERLRRHGDRVTYLHGRFSDLERLFRESGLERVDGLISDLGVSYYQLTEGSRGFSYQIDCDLDMRMDRASGGRTAEELVNFSSERELSDAAAVGSVVPRTWIHPVLQRTFMAIRMAVNEELEELEALLEGALSVLRPGGRMVAISFHSLEDRMVKHAFIRMSREGRAAILTKKVVRPGDEETSRNPASRSAKLRAAEVR